MDLLIDGNALLNVTGNAAVYSIRKNSNFDSSFITVEGGKNILKDSSKLMFKNLILKYLASVITPLKTNLTNVYFTFDETSWRKFYVKKHFERNPESVEFTYKGNRKMDETKRELYMFFDYFKDEVLPDILEIPGIHNIRVKGSEGDDVIAVLAEHLHCPKVIWTVDSDLSQLVKPGNNFTIVMGPKNKEHMKKLVLPEGYDAPAKPMGLDDFTIDGFGIASLAKYLVGEREYQSLVVEPNDFTLRKIIMGDMKSDNIPSIYVKILNERRYGITEKSIEKIFARLEKEFDRMRWLELIDSGDSVFIDKVIELTEETIGAGKDKIPSMVERFKLNTRLIRLSLPMIPPEMITMIKYKFSQLDLSKKFDYRQYLDYAYEKQD